MNVSISGRDRTADLGRQVAETAASLKAKGTIGALYHEHSALALKRAPHGDEFTRWFVDLLRIRHGVMTTDYYIPHGPGLRGRLAVRLRQFLWRLLRYQHDRIAFQQNLINEMAIRGLEFQQEQMGLRFSELMKRIDQLESRGANGGSK